MALPGAAGVPTIHDVYWNAEASLQAGGSSDAARPGPNAVQYRLIALDLVGQQLAAATSRLDVALRVAEAAAHLTGEGPCLVALNPDGNGPAIMASSVGRTLPIDLLDELDPPRSDGTSRRWVVAERLGYGPDDPLVRLVARCPIPSPSSPTRAVGTLFVFEHKGGLPLDPAALSGTRVLASLAGLALAGGTSAGQCGCSAEAERLRILAELHDGLLQSLYGLVLEIEAATTRPVYPAAVRAEAARWQEVLATAIDDTRSILERIDKAESATPALGAGLDMLAAETAASNGIDVDTQVVMESEVPVSAEIRRGVLAVAQEALRNSVRHSGARQIRVRLRVDTRALNLTVTDDGLGFVPSGVRRGHGLRSMVARAQAMGGHMEVTSSPGTGARVALWAPLTAPEPAPGDRAGAGVAATE